MCACMYVGMYVGMYACMYIRMYVCSMVRMHGMYVYICRSGYTKNTCKHEYIHTYIHTYSTYIALVLDQVRRGFGEVILQTYIHTHMQICTYVHTHIRGFICV